MVMMTMTPYSDDDDDNDDNDDDDDYDNDENICIHIYIYIRIIYNIIHLDTCRSSNQHRERETKIENAHRAMTKQCRDIDDDYEDVMVMRSIDDA